MERQSKLINHALRHGAFARKTARKQLESNRLSSRFSSVSISSRFWFLAKKWPRENALFLFKSGWKKALLHQKWLAGILKVQFAWMMRCKKQKDFLGEIFFVLSIFRNLMLPGTILHQVPVLILLRRRPVKLPMIACSRMK